MTNATVTGSGDPLRWLTSSMAGRNAAMGYTAVASSGGQYPELAVNGHNELWSLCPFNNGQVNVVFNVSADIPPPPYLGFNPADCYDVKLNIIPTCEFPHCSLA
jgi:hypothetical protein